MKSIIGLLLVITGIVVGVYCGLWWAFIGGIVVVIEQCKAPELEAMALACGIARVVGASLIGTLSSFCFIIPGLGLIKSS